MKANRIFDVIATTIKLENEKYCVQDSPIDELELLDDVGPSLPGAPEPAGNRDRYERVSVDKESTDLLCNLIHKVTGCLSVYLLALKDLTNR